VAGSAGPFPVSRLELREDLARGPEVEPSTVECGPAEVAPPHMEAAATWSRLARRAWRPAAVAPVGHPRTAGDGHRSLGRSSWTLQPGYRA
jgi:hypothetical protein